MGWLIVAAVATFACGVAIGILIATAAIAVTQTKGNS